MKKKKVGIIASSVAAIAVCSSMVVGSTLALFTSEDKVNIAVTSGKVEVFAAPVISGTSTTLGEEKAPMVNATVDGGNVTLEGMVPGDKVDIAIDVTNKSTISVKYQLSMNITNDNGLFAGLNFDITQGLESKGEFAAAENTEIGDKEGTINISVSLPESAGNAYQGKTCDIDLIVEAVQSNGELTNSVGNVELINSVKELKDFRDTVNGGANYANKYVLLMNDIDLENEAWTPIGNAELYKNNYELVKGSYYADRETIPLGYNTFTGTFNGNGKTISNLSIKDTDDLVNRKNLVGLFGCVGESYFTASIQPSGSFGQIPATITNLNIKNTDLQGKGRVGALAGQIMAGSVIDNITVTDATINAANYIGGVVGYVYDGGTVTNCKVSNSQIVSGVYLNGEKLDKGDKIGGIVGYGSGLTLAKCSVENISISAVRDFGGIIGYVTYSDRCEFNNGTFTTLPDERINPSITDVKVEGATFISIVPEGAYDGTPGKGLSVMGRYYSGIINGKTFASIDEFNEQFAANVSGIEIK